MSVPSFMFAEMYDLLNSYNETSKMNRETFINWYPSQMYSMKIEFKTLIFICNKPFNCYVERNIDLVNDCQSITDEELIKLNEELSALSSKIYKIKAFW